MRRTRKIKRKEYDEKDKEGEGGEEADRGSKIRETRMKLGIIYERQREKEEENRATNKDDKYEGN